MRNELIDRIEVYQAEKIDGEWVQHLTIHYNCVGAIFIPEVFPLPAPEVSVNTRKGAVKGAVVNDAPCRIAILYKESECSHPTLRLVKNTRYVKM